MAHSLANFHGDTISLDANVLVGVIDADAVLEPVMAIDIESMRGEANQWYPTQRRYPRIRDEAPRPHRHCKRRRGLR